MRCRRYAVVDSSSTKLASVCGEMRFHRFLIDILKFWNPNDIGVTLKCNFKCRHLPAIFNFFFFVAFAPSRSRWIFFFVCAERDHFAVDWLQYFQSAFCERLVWRHLFMSQLFCLFSAVAIFFPLVIETYVRTSRVLLLHIVFYLSAADCNFTDFLLSTKFSFFFQMLALCRPVRNRPKMIRGWVSCWCVVLSRPKSHTVECWATKKSFMHCTLTTFVPIRSKSTWTTSKCPADIPLDVDARLMHLTASHLQQKDGRIDSLEARYDFVRFGRIMDGACWRHGSGVAFMAIHRRLR